MSEVRVGYVSSIDYENGLCEIHYPDRDDTVTEMVPFLSNREYRTPEVEDKVINGKAKPEYVGPKLKEYTCDILLDAAHGVNPRKMLKRLTQMAEDGEVHYFIIGFAPLSENRFRITDVSESWDAVIKHGLLVQCKVSLTIKEYV